MTKEELEKEANKFADENATPDLDYSFRVDIFEASKEGYLAGAEPREKRIEELEAQIEKMKCCENCRYREPYCEEAIRLPFSCCCEKWELKEIKENE